MLLRAAPLASSGLPSSAGGLRRFHSKGLQPVAQFDERVINHIKQIPWGHNQRIINKCKTIDEAIYYVDKTIENGWSRNVLEHQMESGLYDREGKSITNFEKRLPALQSDLAR